MLEENGYLLDRIARTCNDCQILECIGILLNLLLYYVKLYDGIVKYTCSRKNLKHRKLISLAIQMEMGRPIKWPSPL